MPALPTSLPFPPAAPHLRWPRQWLERDLQLADRCSTPWLVLSMHRPMYVVYPHKSNRIVADHLRWVQSREAEGLEGLPS